MTPQQLAEELDRRKRETQAVFAIGGADPDAHSSRGVNPIVQAAIDSYKPSPEPSVTPSTKEGAVNVSLGGALKGATIPFSPGVAPPATSQTAEEGGVTPAEGAMQAPDGYAGATNSFYDMILQNDAVRLHNKDAWERREKADRARVTIASVADALASLGNLIGTTAGAANQPQTYQVPFVQEDVEKARAVARQRADMLLRNDQTVRLAQARQEATENAYALRQALEEEKTRRALANIAGKLAVSSLLVSSGVGW